MREFKRRYILLTGMLLASLLLYREARPLIWRMIHRPGDRIETHVVHAGRGDLLDARRHVIATDSTVFDIHFDCCMIDNSTEWEEQSRLLAQKIATILPERTAPQWWDYFQNARRSRRRYIPIVKNTNLSIVESLRTLPIFSKGKRGGFICESKVVRIYPYGDLGRRTIGAWNSGMNQYLFGVEKAMDDTLHGEDGYTKKKIGRRRGRNVQLTVDTKDQTDGADVHTTLFMDYQAYADSILRKAIESEDDIAGGCLVVMEVKTGAIVTLANSHRIVTGAIGEYFNYALNYSYEPGAVAHTMTLASALSDGMITSLDEKIPTRHGVLGSKINTDPYIIRYEKAHRTDSISVVDGFAMSSRYMASHIASLYSDTPDYFFDWYGAYCVKPSEFIIHGMPDMRIMSQEGDSLVDLMSVGAGYGFTMCPLQVLTFYNTIANGGMMMLPMLIKGIENTDDGYRMKMPRERKTRVLDQAVADTLRRALTACIEEGTGKRLSGMQQQMAGKTGTSRQVIAPNLRGNSTDPYHDEVGRCQYASTFVGFYPADAPHYTVMCVLFTNPTLKSHPGGIMPADIVKEFVTSIESIR